MKIEINSKNVEAVRASLTELENKVIDLRMAGYSWKDICEKMNIGRRVAYLARARVRAKIEALMEEGIL